MAAPTPDPFKNLKEHPHTYVVQNRSSDDDLIRLDAQDRMFTECMGGVLAEQLDPTRFQSVLDVACGPGWWLIEVAKTYPSISQLVGVDISAKSIDHAQAQAKAVGVSDRVHFQTGDALRILDFSSESFDLVNLRFGMSWVRKWDWPRLIREFQRVAKPGGVVRITESAIGTSNSPAMNRLFDLIGQAFFNAGHFFTAGAGGITDHLAEQMRKYGVMNVQTQTHRLEFRHNTQAFDAYVEDMRKVFELAAPFIKKWVKFSDDYDELIKQMVKDMQQPDFETSVTLLTAWGEAFKPDRVVS